MDTNANTEGTAKMGNRIVSVKTKRGGSVDCAVVSARYITRGKGAGLVEYQLAPLAGKQGAAYGFTAIGEQHLTEAKGSYTEAQITAAVAAFAGTACAVEEKKYQRDEQRQALLAELAVGDEVLVGYSNGAKWEKVQAINERTGKFAVARLVARQGKVHGKVRWLGSEVIRERRPR